MVNGQIMSDINKENSNNYKCYGKYSQHNTRCNICEYKSYCIDATNINKTTRNDLKYYNDQIINNNSQSLELDSNVIINSAKGIADFYLKLKNPKDIIIAFLISAGYSVRQVEAISLLPKSTVKDSIDKLKKNQEFNIVFNHYNKKRN